ncbi:2-succinyl-6-hydroxy-2,4-cyclohexadiene-1-carboxylate synthase [Weissella confusa]
MDKLVLVNDYPYHVRIEGDGAPTWLFFHGFMGSFADYEQVQPGGTRVYLDLLGFGGQTPIASAERFNATNQALDIVAILDTLGVEKVNLVGYSMGARLALAFANQFPERLQRLFLESGTAGIANQADRESRVASDEQKADRIERDGMDAFVADWEKLPLFASQQNVSAERQAFMHEQRVNQTATNVANSLRGFGTGAMPNYWPELANLQVPVVLISGMDDVKFTTINERMAVQLPDAVQVQVVSAGHNVHFEKPDEVTFILMEYANDAD